MFALHLLPSVSEHLSEEGVLGQGFADALLSFRVEDPGLLVHVPDIGGGGVEDVHQCVPGLVEGLVECGRLPGLRRLPALDYQLVDHPLDLQLAATDRPHIVSFPAEVVALAGDHHREDLCVVLDELSGPESNSGR